MDGSDEWQLHGSRDKTSELMLRSFQVGLTMGSMVSLLVGLFLVFNTVEVLTGDNPMD